jgi:hypothetical protein
MNSFSLHLQTTKMEFRYINRRYISGYACTNKKALCLLLVVFALWGCKKNVGVDAPPTAVTGNSVYLTDENAASVLTGIYTSLSNTSYLVSSFPRVSLYCGLSADEFTLWSGITDQIKIAYYTNSLSSTIAGAENWVTIYPYVYRCNAAIEGLSNSTSLTPAVRQQLLGEAKFMRAFFYFYLVNLYGDVPLLLSTDYKINSTAARTPQKDVYNQIIADLTEAQGLLSATYLKADAYSMTTERLRPTRWAATALLARSYLYTMQFAKAEEQASALIENSSLFSLTTINGTFQKNSKESIWQLQPVIAGWNTEEARMFILLPSGPISSKPVYLSPALMSSFEINDKRKTSWINSYSAGGVTYNFPYKYQSASLNAPVTEYFTVFRLAEQYLIRSEARAQQGKISEAQADLNQIRTRAGLSNTSASDKATLLNAILHERQDELFAEWGHRWLDLKRTSSIDSVMTTAASFKGSTWQPYKVFYPLSTSEIMSNTALVQTTGY